MARNARSNEFASISTSGSSRYSNRPSRRSRLKLFYLPPYWPHLNPDEQVWAHVKRSVSKRLVQTKDEMKRLAIGALHRIQKLPAMVKSFFRQPECEYAAM